MPKYYFTDETGRHEVSVSVEVARAILDCRREEWRCEAKARYHTVSLERLTEAGMDFAEPPKEDTENKLKIEALRIALLSLTAPQRALLRDVYRYGLKQREIARRDGVDESAVSKRLGRIYKKLRAELSSLDPSSYGAFFSK